MKSAFQIVSVLAALSFALLVATGIDLNHGRTGYVLVALGGAISVLAGATVVKPSPNLRFGFAILVLLTGAYFVGRALIGGPEGLSFPDVALVLGGLGVYLGVILSGEKARRLWLGMVFVLAVLNASVAIYQQWTPEAFYFWHGSSGDAQKIVGLFGHYNAFASYLNGSVFFLLSYVVLGKQTVLRILLAAGAVVVVAGLIYSGSRGGWISFVIGGGVWLVFLVVNLKRDKSRLFAPIAILGTVLVVVGGATSAGVIQRMTEKRHLESDPDLDLQVDLSEADGGRFAFQQMGFEIFQDEPIFGSGPRAFSYRSLEKWDLDSLGMRDGLPVFAHNEYVQVLSDYGLVGFLLLLAVVFGHGILGLIRVYLGDADSREIMIWTIGAAGGLVAMLAQSFFSFLFHFPACLALAALQLGLFASPQSRSRVRVGVSGRIMGLMGLALAISLVMIGLPLGKSYRLQLQGREELAGVMTKDDAFRAYEILTAAGNLANEPEFSELIARDATTRAIEAEEDGDLELARDYNLRAKKALERALELNPYLGEGIVGIPLLDDKLGNFSEAEKGHKIAMSKLWTREYTLRPHFNAARSSFFKSFRVQDTGDSLVLLYQARERLQKRLEILRTLKDTPALRGFGPELEAWIAYREGRLLFEKGQEIWSNRRPRDPALAMALLLEARKRYEASKAVVAEKEALWEQDWKQLEMNLGALKAGRTNPVVLTPEEVGKYLTPEVGLATDESNR